MPKLENWKLKNGRLLGLIYNDNRFENGTCVITSPVVSINQNKLQAQTENTVYLLGKKAKE